ncbi:hypothetical protein CLW00_103249 [Mongoliibacter ruber]|uniref:Uncharacterized protein n=1 Tax=Mongoliibacter ruber TaxID=1750599 RepID=A0A2T0WR20_9BACT|nr:hypothetical protein CLW00_103249 [Mongoliibacter ruber]
MKKPIIFLLVFTDTVEETAASMDAVYNPEEPLPKKD